MTTPVHKPVSIGLTAKLLVGRASRQAHANFVNNDGKSAEMTTTIATVPATASATGARFLAGLEELLEFLLDRGFGEGEVSETEVRFAVALARYRFVPPTGRMLTERIHVMTFGGAGAGKSTVTNTILSADLAEVNPQAGYTRHPVAFLKSDIERPSELWPERLGLLLRHDSAERANIDDHRFGWRRLHGELADPGFLRRHVVWDCPDLTAKDSTHYQSRVIEIAALAQVTVYVASDERYNDELPTNFLQAMLDAGKWVVVVLTKASPEESDELVALFRDQVVTRLRNAERILAVVPIPAPPPGRFGILWTDAMPYGQQLRDTVERVTGDFASLQSEAKRSAVRYLRSQQARLLDPLRQDLAEWRAWIELVRQNANEAVLRYERDYLARVQHRELSHALHEFLGLFTLNGVFEILWRGQELLRSPFRLAKTFWKRFAPSLPISHVDEERAIEKVRRGMLESLQVTAATRKYRHRLWQDLHKALHEDAVELIEPAFYRIRNRQRRHIEEQLETVGQTVRSEIERVPLAVPVLKLSRVLVDLVAIAAAVYVGGFTPLSIVLVVLVMGLTDELVRLACQQYVNRHRASLARRQKDNIRELIQHAYIDPLLQMPPSIGKRLQTLSTLTERLEADLKRLAEECGERDRA